MAEMNARIPVGSAVWCDGGHYDEHWLAALAAAARIEPTFTLGNIGTLLAGFPGSTETFHRSLQRTELPHRAGPDAQRLCSALVEMIFPPAPVFDLYFAEADVDLGAD